MKKRYIIFSISFVLALLFFGSCEEDYIPPTGEPSHAYITTSFGDQPVRLQVNDTMDFLDFSRGIVTRTWTFPDGITDILDSDNDLTDTASLVKVRFTVPGEYTVKIEQEYLDTAYAEGEFTETKTYEKTISVYVVDYVRADFEAQLVIPEDYTYLINEDGAQNEVMAAREVFLTFTGTGEPENLNWYLTRQENNFTRMLEGDSIDDATFNSMGTYDITLIASSEFGSDTISYTSWLSSVPSTDPLLLYSLEAIDGKIYAEFSRDIANPATCPLEAFELLVTNGLDTIPINISSLSLDPIQNNIVIMNLDAEIYNSDNIILAYDSTVGTLISADDMNVADIEQQVLFEVTNLLENTPADYSFELYDETIWRSGAWASPFSQSYLMEMSPVKVHDGDLSAYFAVPMDSGSVTIQMENATDFSFVSFPLTGGQRYRCEYWVYMESKGDIINEADPPSDIRVMIQLGSSFIDGGPANFPTMENDYPVEEWVRHDFDWTPTSSDDYNIAIRGHNENNTEDLHYYLDDISISIVEERP